MNLDTDKLVPLAPKGSRAELLRLLNAINADHEWDLIPDLAYFLATIQHETAATYRPLEEIGKGKGKPYGTATSNGKIYYGRGFVQITWKTNYLKAGRLLGLDLVAEPEKALELDTAYKIASRGMREGWFTGKTLSYYINAGHPDYVGARHIINGTDRAGLIADYAKKWEKALTDAQVLSSAQGAVTGAAPSSPIEPAAGILSLQGVTSHFDEAKDAVEKVSDVAETVSGFVGKRSDTVKSFRIFITQSLTGACTLLAGFYKANETFILFGLGIIAFFGLLYFLRQWHLGAIRERK